MRPCVKLGIEEKPLTWNATRLYTYNSIPIELELWIEAARRLIVFHSRAVLGIPVEALGGTNWHSMAPFEKVLIADMPCQKRFRINSHTGPYSCRRHGPRDRGP
jgi:hypothetical protein